MNRRQRKRKLKTKNDRYLKAKYRFFQSLRSKEGPKPKWVIAPLPEFKLRMDPLTLSVNGEVYKIQEDKHELSSEEKTGTEGY